MPRSKYPAIRLDKAISEFEATLRSYHPPIADHTVKVKISAVRFLIDHAPQGPRTLVRNLTAEIFNQAFIDIVTGDGGNSVKGQRSRKGQKSPNSQSGLRTTFKQFGKFIVAKKWIARDFDPMFQITHSSRPVIGSKKEREDYLRIPYKDWPRLLDAAKHPRDRFMIAFMLWTTRRASDTVVMRWHDVNLEENRIQLYNIKRGRRVSNGFWFPIWEPLRQEIDRYRDWVWEQCGRHPGADWPLIPGKGYLRKGQIADPETWPLLFQQPSKAYQVSAQVKRVLARFGVPKNQLDREGAHTLRRSAIRFFKDTLGIEAARVLADHLHIQETDGYAGPGLALQTIANFRPPAPGSPPPPAPLPPPPPLPAPEPVTWHVTPEPVTWTMGDTDVVYAAGTYTI